MASRTLITYNSNIGDTVYLTVEHSTTGIAMAFDEATVKQWALDNTPADCTLGYVSFSPEYKKIFP